MTIRFILGGPANSGKSTLVLSLVQTLQSRGLRAAAHELDVWSNSYPAFAGTIPFKDRPKKKGLDWDWQTPLRERVAAFNDATEDVVLGDMPGAYIDVASDFMCEQARADAAIVVSSNLEGMREWAAYFEKKGYAIAYRCLTFLGEAAPMTLSGLDRKIDPGNPDIVRLGELLMAKIGGGA